MMKTEIEPVRRSVSVMCSAERAFQIFTEGIGEWWPLETHSVAADTALGRATNAVLEPRQEGRLYEVNEDGTEADWARVVVWEPPRRIVLAWKPNPDRSAPTEVEIRFEGHPDGAVVELEHRGWERLGDDGPEVRDAYDGGWPKTLARFAAAAA